MAFQQKEGQGSLFKNEKQNDRQPDMKGSVMIKGILYDIAAWNRTSQNGREYLSLQISEKQAADAPAQRAPQQPWQSAPQKPSQGWQSPAPSYQDLPEPAPAPTMDDFPGEDLPF